MVGGTPSSPQNKTHLMMGFLFILKMKHNKHFFRDKYNISLAIYDEYLRFGRTPYTWDKSYSTHSEASVISNKVYSLYTEGCNNFSNRSVAPKWFRKKLNRTERQKAKQDINREINGYDKRYTPRYVGANYDFF
jgi:hypothetical protein